VGILQPVSGADDRLGSKNGRRAMSAPMSGLPESRHGWAIYESRPLITCDQGSPASVVQCPVRL
jgi:hypothetical protein